MTVDLEILPDLLRAPDGTACYLRRETITATSGQQALTRINRFAVTPTRETVGWVSNDAVEWALTRTGSSPTAYRLGASAEEHVLFPSGSMKTSDRVRALEEVGTPAGVFECWKVHRDQTIKHNLETVTNVGHLWLAPDVGPVRADYVNTDRGVSLRIDVRLKRYTLH